MGPLHPYELKDGVDPAAVQGVYLAPVNATSRIDEELLEAADRVRTEIRAYLEAMGVEEVSGPLYDYREAWRESFRGVDLAAPEPKRRRHRGRIELPAPPAEAMGRLFEALSESAEFDALLVPDLLVRPARLAGTRAHWDGVQRKQESSRSVPWRGDTPALSLRVRLFRSDGEMIFEGIGGLDLLFRFDYEKAKAEPVDDILGVPEHIEEGVSIAFHPFFPIEER
jgi:hypothetical protein